MEFFKKEFDSINLKFNDINNENLSLTNNVNDLEESLLTVSDEKDILATQNKKMQSIIESLGIKIKSLTNENENYSKVSVVKNLHNQIYEKDNLILQLENKISKLKNDPLEIGVKNTIKTILVEENEHILDEENEPILDEENEPILDEENKSYESGEEVEVEVEFVEKKLKSPCPPRKLTLYLITVDDNKDIYDRLDNGEPGKHVGKLVGKQNKPFFFT